MQGLRLATSLFIILTFLYNIIPYSKDDILLSEDECMRDYTFILTENANKFLLDNEKFKKRYMIYAGFLMDFI